MDHRTSSAIAFVLAFFLSAASHADESAPAATETAPTFAGVLERYAPGTINSTEAADRALADVAQQRAVIEARFSHEEAACYEKFFVTSCLDGAKDRRRTALKQLRTIEVEANAYNRRARAEQRDAALQERQARQEASAADRKSGQGKDDAAPATSKDIADVERRSQQAAPALESDPAAHANTKRAAQHAVDTSQDKEKDSAEAKKREENIKAYERKQQRYLERQREIANRKKESGLKPNEKSE